MLLKFPQVTNNTSDNTFIIFDETPFAKHNVLTKTSSKQVGFLSEHSVMFIIQGKKYFHFGDQTICINNNELILVKRGIYTISEFIPDNGSFEALIIFIPDKFLQSISHYNSDLNASKAETAYVILKRDTYLEQFKSQYLSYFTGDFQGKKQLLQLKLQELFLLLQNSDARQLISRFISSCINKESIDIEYIIRTNLFQPLSIEDYAKLCLRSLASFKRDFKKQFATSPKKWINIQRISYANSLLKTSNKTVAEIAFECGFENTSHFIKIFKNKMGYTPKAMRAKVAII